MLLEMFKRIADIPGLFNVDTSGPHSTHVPSVGILNGSFFLCMLNDSFLSLFKVLIIGFISHRIHLGSLHVRESLPDDEPFHFIFNRCHLQTFPAYSTGQKCVPCFGYRRHSPSDVMASSHAKQETARQKIKGFLLTKIETKKKRELLV